MSGLRCHQIKSNQFKSNQIKSNQNQNQIKSNQSIKQSIKQSIEQSINKCMYGMHSCTLISTLFVYSTYPNNHNINNITSGVQYQATTASVNNVKVFPTLRGLRSLPLHLRVSIHMHASNTYTVIVCFLELLLMRVHTLRSNPKIQKPLTPKHC